MDREQLRFGKLPRDPDLYRDIFGQGLAVDYENRHLVLGIEREKFRGPVLIRPRVEVHYFKSGTRFGQRHVWNERASHRCVVERELHVQSEGGRPSWCQLGGRDTRDRAAIEATLLPSRGARRSSLHCRAPSRAVPAGY